MSLRKAETQVQNSNTANSGRAPKRIGKMDIPTPRDT
jgi:hypothetical protein